MLPGSGLFGHGDEQYKAISHTHHSTRDANKYIGRDGEITISWCDDTIRVHDGNHRGGCRVIDMTFDPATICTAMNTAPVLGNIAGINLPATICAVENLAPVLGNIQF